MSTAVRSALRTGAVALGLIVATGMAPAPAFAGSEAWRPQVLVGYVGPTVRLAQWLVDQGRPIRGVRSVLGAAEALRIARLGYAAGRFPYSDLLMAQRGYAEARRARLSAARDAELASAERDRAAGLYPFGDAQ